MITTEIELAKFNKVMFIESGHSYILDGKPTGVLSVTGLIGEYTKSFDKNVAAKLSAKKHGIPVEDILVEWDDGMRYAQELGTSFHKFAEMLYSRKLISVNNLISETMERMPKCLAPQMQGTFPVISQQLVKFYMENPHIYMVRQEFPVCDMNDTKICGMLDMLCYNSKTNEFEIWDFKSNKKIKTSNPYKEKLLGPLSHLENCELNKYSIQLSIYQYIIEKYTSLRIGKRKVLWFNTQNTGCVEFDIDYLKDEVVAIMHEQGAKSLL